ncbi:MAG: hypothetical protein ACRDYY_18710 [Acidimicrobiales bacterium]
MVTRGFPDAQGAVPSPYDLLTLIAEDHEQISGLLARFSGRRSRLHDHPLAERVAALIDRRL